MTDSQHLTCLLFLLAACSSASSIPGDAGTADASPGDVRQVDAKPRDSGATETTTGDTGSVDTGAEVSLVDSPAETSADSGDAGAPFTSMYPGDVGEGETHLAVGANGYVAAAWMAADWNGQFIDYSFSTDLGSSWSPVRRIADPVGGNAFDPSIAVDAANNFYVSFLTFDNAFTNQHVYVATAPAGTTTFGRPSEVTDPSEGTPSEAGPALYWYDKPWIVVTQDQQIVVTYSRFDASSCPIPAGPPWTACVADIMAAHSTDATSWTPVQITANGGGADAGTDAGVGTFVDWGFPCASATTTRLWVAYEEIAEDLSGGGVTLRYSDDDGASWSSANVVASVSAMGVENPGSCTGDGSDVWVEYELASTAGSLSRRLASSIQVAHSSDGGKTFGAPVNALDTATSAAVWNAQVTLESNGHLDVEYYGGAGEGMMGSVYYVHSIDGGVSWTRAMLIEAPITLTATASTFLTGFIGDYLGIVTSGGFLYTTLTNNWSSMSRVDFVKLALP